MRKKKKLIIILSIVGLILGVIGGFGAYFIIESQKPPVELEDTEAKYQTTLKEAPTDGSLPMDHDATDVIAYTLWTVANSAEFKVITTGIADAGITTQDISNERVVKNGQAMVSTISSGLISLGTQRFFFNQSENKVLSRTADKIEGLRAVWNNSDAPECVTYKEMRRRYGWYPFQANGYIICDETYINKDDIKVIDNGNGTYSINFSLDPDGEKAPFWYRREVITSSGSTMVPVFSSININFTIDSTYHLLRQDIKEEYTVKAMGVEATTNTDVSDVFTYENVEFNKECYDWFMQYKSLEPVADKETDEIEVKEDDIMTMVVSSLQTSDNSNLNLKLNAKALGLNIEGLASLNINDLNNVYVLAKIEDYIYVEYSNNNIYLAINDIKYKISLSDLSLGNEEENNESSESLIDVDSILSDLNSGKVSIDGDNRIIDTTLNILGIKLDLLFNIDKIDGRYILNNAKADIDLFGTNIEIVIEKTNNQIQTIDHQEFNDLAITDLINNIKNIIDNKELNVKASLNYNDILVNIDANISFKDGLFIDSDLSLNIDNNLIELHIILSNNNLYLSYGDINLSLNINDIIDIVKLFVDLDTNIDLKDLDLSNINLKSIISKLTELGIEVLENDTKVNISYDNIDLSVELLNIEIDEEFDSSIYYDSSNILSYIKNSLTKEEAKILIDNIKNIILNKELGIELELNINDINVNVNGELSFNDGIYLNANVNLEIDENIINLDIILSDNVLYISYDSYKLSVDIDDILYLVNLFLDKNIDLNNFDIKSLGSLFESMESIDIASILDNIKNIDFNILNDITNLNVIYDNISASVKIINKNIEKNSNLEGYYDLGNILSYIKNSLTKDEAKLLIDNIKEIIINKELKINLEFETTDLDLSLNGELSFKDGIFINANVDLKYKTLDLPLNIIFDGDYLYIKLDNFKLSISLDSVMNIVNLFLNKNIDLNNLDIKSLFEGNESLDIASILDKLTAIDINAYEKLTNLFVQYDSYNIELNLESINVNKDLDFEGYIDLSGLIDDISSKLDHDDIDYLTDIVSKIIEFVKEKEFYINLDLSLEKDDSKYLDINGFIKFFVYDNGRFDLEIKATIKEYDLNLIKMTHNIDIKLLAKEYFIANEIDEFNEDYLFMTYGTNPNEPNNLIKMKTPAKDLLSVLGTLTQLLGIDLTFLNNYSTFNFNEVDASQIKNLFSGDNNISIDFDNLINDLIVNQNNLLLDINLSDLLKSSNLSTKLTLDLNDTDTKKAFITINDLFVNDNLKIDVNDISLLKEEVYIDLPNTDGWYDISSIDELISALLMTATNKDFEIKGEIQLTAIGIPAIKADTHVKVNVNEDGSFVLYARLDFSGIGTLLTNNWCEIYYSDGYVIIRSYKKVLFSKTDKAIKVTADDFLKDIKYYLLSFGIGLSESLINSMDSGETASSQDASKVLTKYEYKNDIYTIGLNLGELTGISGLNNLEVGLGLSEMTVNDDLTADAITSIESLSLNLYTVLTVKLSKAIKLTNIIVDEKGNSRFISVDMTTEKNFIANYSYEVGVQHNY